MKRKIKISNENKEKYLKYLNDRIKDNSIDKKERFIDILIISNFNLIKIEDIYKDISNNKLKIYYLIENYIRFHYNLYNHYSLDRYLEDNISFLIELNDIFISNYMKLSNKYFQFILINKNQFLIDYE